MCPIKPERLGVIKLGQVKEWLDTILNGPLAMEQHGFVRDLASIRDECFTAS